jgi:aminomethyltransferase
MTPFEAGLGRFAELDKKEFLGREALVNAARGRRLFGVQTPGPTPSGGDMVFDGTRRVGRVTTGAYSPFLECGIGYVRLDQLGDWIGKSLTLHRGSGHTTGCCIVELPFYDTERHLVRIRQAPT